MLYVIIITNIALGRDFWRWRQTLSLGNFSHLFFLFSLKNGVFHYLFFQVKHTIFFSLHQKPYNIKLRSESQLSNCSSKSAILLEIFSIFAPLLSVGLRVPSLVSRLAAQRKPRNNPYPLCVPLKGCNAKTAVFLPPYSDITPSMLVTLFTTSMTSSAEFIMTTLVMPT